MSRTDGGDDRYRIEKRAPSDQRGSPTYTTTVDAEGAKDPVVTELISVVSTATGTRATGLEPLSVTVDPDALERLVYHWQRGSRARSPATVTFEYEGCTIEVRADGRLTVDATGSGE